MIRFYKVGLVEDVYWGQLRLKDTGRRSLADWRTLRRHYSGGDGGREGKEEEGVRRETQDGSEEKGKMRGRGV